MARGLRGRGGVVSVGSAGHGGRKRKRMREGGRGGTYGEGSGDGEEDDFLALPRVGGELGGYRDEATGAD